MDEKERLFKLIVGARAKCHGRVCDICEYKDAAGCFEHLLVDRLIANGVVVREWIPVTERLPEEGQEVIACILHRFGDKSVISITFWSAKQFSWQDVTHWMPLPEPPKEGE